MTGRRVRRMAMGGVRVERRVELKMVLVRAKENGRLQMQMRAWRQLRRRLSKSLLMKRRPPAAMAAIAIDDTQQLQEHHHRPTTAPQTITTAESGYSAGAGQQHIDAAAAAAIVAAAAGNTAAEPTCATCPGGVSKVEDEGKLKQIAKVEMNPYEDPDDLGYLADSTAAGQAATGPRSESSVSDCSRTEHTGDVLVVPIIDTSLNKCVGDVFKKFAAMLRSRQASDEPSSPSRAASVHFTADDESSPDNRRTDVTRQRVTSTKPPALHAGCAPAGSRLAEQ